MDENILNNLTSDVSEHYEGTVHDHRLTCIDGIIDKAPSSHNNFCLVTNHNDNDKNPWIMIDLTGKKFDKVVLHNRVDCCQSLINGATVSITSDKDGKQILWTDSVPSTSDKVYTFSDLPFTTDKNPLSTIKKADTTTKTTPKQEPVKQEPVKQEPVKQEPVKQEPVKQETTKQETTKQETTSTETIAASASKTTDSSNPSQENVGKIKTSQFDKK